MHPDDTHPAWQSLFDEHAAGMILFARQWCRAHADAEDVVQEVFAHRWRLAAQANDPAAYLYISVKHCAMDQRRSESRRLQREAAAAQMKIESSQGESCFESSASQHEETAMIETHLNMLPADQREVLVLKIWGELTFAQIAQVMDASANTIASRYRYALQALRQLMPQEVMT